MVKLKLNEEQLKNILEKQIYESLNFESSKGLSSFARKRVGDVLTHIMDKAKNAKEGDEILNKASEYGINKDYLQGRINRDEYKEEYRKRLSELMKEKNKAITDWVKDGLPLLRKCVVGMGLRQDLDRYQKFKSGKSTQKFGNGDITAVEKDSNNNQIEGTSFILTPQQKSEVLLLKDFLDKLSLSFLYRDFERPKTVKTRFGIETNNKSINDTTDVDEIGLDFGKLTNDELFEFYSSRRAKINKWADFVRRSDDEITQILNQIDTESRKNQKDKKNSKKSDEPNMFYDDKMGDDVKNLTSKLYERQMAKRYLDRTYGMMLDFGGNNDMFKFGNAKISNDTLIVNFQAAMRCPAWQQCIMKDACYAKVSEMNYDNTLNSNLKKGFIWEQTKTDKKLMQLMSSLIRACMINYQKAIQEYEKKNGASKNNVGKQMELELNEGYSNFNSELSNKLCEMTFNDVEKEYGQEMITLLSNYKNGTLIRLNENGDFIGQWLVDAWEDLANDFDKVGIKVAAYTCRALNYEKVKKMILNISQANIVFNQNSEAFAHYFYAVTHDEYDDFSETYSDIDSNYEIVIDKEGKITPCYRNLVDENGELCGYYYKCPCGRGKYTYNLVDASSLNKNEIENAVKTTHIPIPFKGGYSVIKYLDNYYKLVEQKSSDEMVDCYRCRICYGRDAFSNIKCEDGTEPRADLPVFVFVAVHGENSGIFSDKNNNRKILGKDVSYWANLCKNASKNKTSKINENAMNFGENIGYNDDSVMKAITNNMTYSVANMMRGKTLQLNEIKKKFNEILKTL